MSGKRGKNDAADAAAICEAVQRPHMRYGPIKSMERGVTDQVKGGLIAG